MNRNLVWQSHSVDRNLRSSIKHHRPCLLWFTGLSGSGKSTLAGLIEHRLACLHAHTYLLDGDNIRHRLCRDLGFSAKDREENISRVGEVGRMMVDAGLIVLTALISPFRAHREIARSLLPRGDFIEIFVDAPLEECERRDPKGLYRKARSGQIADFTGIDSPYEKPLAPALHLETHRYTVEECAGQVIAYLFENAFLEPNERLSPATGLQTPLSLKTVK